MAIDVNNTIPTDMPDENSNVQSSVTNSTFVGENNVSQQTNNNDSQSEDSNDPNKIKVTITDERAPIVVLFGPPSCGKTMTLVRLSRYLYREGFKVEVDAEFKEKTDSHYQELIKTFDSMVESEKAATGTDLISFLLVKVSDKQGKTICQILEAPGEHYFNPNDSKAVFPKYVNTIIQSNNRKIYSIFVEPSWDEASSRKGYVERVKKLSTMMSNGDKVLFIFNKIDKTNFVIRPGVISMNNAIKNIMDLYPNMFEAFKNQNPITKFFKKFNCEVVPFQTGMYNGTVDGGLMYTQSDDIYPKILWNKLYSLVRG